MLFLAVFCGFLAEYTLEHKIEKEREGQYVFSMKEDLNADIKMLEEAINENQRLILGKDSFIVLLDKGKWTADEITTLYDMHWRYIGFNPALPFSKRTINQLMNAGGLRLIRNKAISDSITIYAANVDFIENHRKADDREASDLALYNSAAIFDNRFIRFSPDLKGRRMPVSDRPLLLTEDWQKIKTFAFMLEQDKDTKILTTIALQEIEQRANGLIQALKREYHLK